MNPCGRADDLFMLYFVVQASEIIQLMFELAQMLLSEDMLIYMKSQFNPHKRFRGLVLFSIKGCWFESSFFLGGGLFQTHLHPSILQPLPDCGLIGRIGNPENKRSLCVFK